MKTIMKRFWLFLAALAFILATPFPPAPWVTMISAQGTALNYTNLSSAMTDTSGQVAVLAATTGVSAPTTSSSTFLYVDGELMEVTAINTTTKVATVVRGVGGTRGSPHQANAFVIVGPGTSFITYDPSGACTIANQLNLPLVNVRNGNIWQCLNTTSSGTPVWQASNFTPIMENKPRTAVSAAYTILPTDYLVVLSTTGTGTGGTSVAVKTFTMPSHVGLLGKQIFIKDESGGLTATTNIVLAGTIDGTNSGTATVIQLKTAYQAVLLEAGSGGWFVLSCYGNPGGGAGAAVQNCR